MGIGSSLYGEHRFCEFARYLDLFFSSSSQEVMKSNNSNNSNNSRSIPITKSDSSPPSASVLSQRPHLSRLLPVATLDSNGGQLHTSMGVMRWCDQLILYLASALQINTPSSSPNAFVLGGWEARNVKVEVMPTSSSSSSSSLSSSSIMTSSLSSYSPATHKNYNNSNISTINSAAGVLCQSDAFLTSAPPSVGGPNPHSLSLTHANTSYTSLNDSESIVTAVHNPPDLVVRANNEEDMVGNSTENIISNRTELVRSISDPTRVDESHTDVLTTKSILWREGGVGGGGGDRERDRQREKEMLSMWGPGDHVTFNPLYGRRNPLSDDANAEREKSSLMGRGGMVQVRRD